jgi:adenylyltransferase/sulfurtransferase
LVYGAVSQFEGQVAVFNCTNKNGDWPVNYRDLFPNPPKDDEVLNCAEAGVLGVLPGIIGTMQANETIKLITGMGNPLINTLLTYNALNNSIYEVELTATNESRGLIPKTGAAFKQMDYNLLCASAVNRFEITVAHFEQLRQNSNIQIIDVREPGEVPVTDEFNYVQIPLSQFKEKINTVPDETVVVFCQTGKRSLQAAQWLFDTFGESKKIYSLKGGILNWLNNLTTQKL